MGKGLYIEDKDKTGLLHFWKIRMGRTGKFHINVYIWKTSEDMYRNAFPGGLEEQDFVGCYIGYPDRKKTVGKFGEIHIIEEYAGAAVVVHEFEHALLDWTQHTYKVVNSQNHEKICHVMSDMNHMFWKRYYRYEVKNVVK